jgi:hypothetical protein
MPERGALSCYDGTVVSRLPDSGRMVWVRSDVGGGVPGRVRVGTDAHSTRIRFRNLTGTWVRNE